MSWTYQPKDHIGESTMRVSRTTTCRVTTDENIYHRDEKGDVTDKVKCKKHFLSCSIEVKNIALSSKMAERKASLQALMNTPWGKALSKQERTIIWTEYFNSQNGFRGDYKLNLGRITKYIKNLPSAYLDALKQKLNASDSEISKVIEMKKTKYAEEML